MSLVRSRTARSSDDTEHTPWAHTAWSRSARSSDATEHTTWASNERSSDDRPLLGRAVRDPVLLQSTLLGRTLLGHAVQSILPDGRRGNILGSKSLLSGVNHNGRIVLHRSVDRNHRTQVQQSIYGGLLQTTTIGADLHRSVDLMLQSRAARSPANYK